VKKRTEKSLENSLKRAEKSLEDWEKVEKEQGMGVRNQIKSSKEFQPFPSLFLSAQLNVKKIRKNNLFQENCKGYNF